MYDDKCQSQKWKRNTWQCNEHKNLAHKKRVTNSQNTTLTSPHSKRGKGNVFRGKNRCKVTPHKPCHTALTLGRLKCKSHKYHMNSPAAKISRGAAVAEAALNDAVEHLKI